MDVEISIQKEKVGTNNSMKEEVKKGEGGASKEMLEDEIWRKRRKRIHDALAAARNAEQQDPACVFAAAGRLQMAIFHDDVEKFVAEIESLAKETDRSAIVNCLNQTGSSLLHIAALAGKDDVLRLLLEYVPGHLITAQNDSGDTPLHVAVKAKRSTAAAMLIRRARDLPNVEDKNQILRMKNKHGNTALHEAVLSGNADMVRDLLKEDLEPVYWKNEYQISPLYMAVNSKNPEMHEVLISLSLEPSRIQGLPPIHGVILHARYDLANLILKKNMKIFTMTDSRGGNIFHLAAYLNMAQAFQLLGPDTDYLAYKWDMNGDPPIHIASKMGHVELIKKLLPVSPMLNGQGQTVLHVAAKYGRTSAVRHMLKDPKVGMLIREVDYAGNTPPHLAAMYSQPAALIPLVKDENMSPGLLNHKCLTAFDIALDRFRREPTLRKRLTLLVLSSPTTGEGIAFSRSLLVLRPEARDEAISILRLRAKRVNQEYVKDSINTRLLVATLVATVTFAAGFAVPGGFNGSDTASKDDRGMATMLDNRLFQAFAICNTIAMFCSMTAVINLIYAQQRDVEVAIAADQHAALPLIIALPTMSVAFLTGVSLTVGKLPWLANTIFCLGLVLLLIISGATLIEYPPLYWSEHRPIRRMILWLVVAYIYWWHVDTYLLDDLEDDGTMNGTLASRPPDGANVGTIDDFVTAQCGDRPHRRGH